MSQYTIPAAGRTVSPPPHYLPHHHPGIFFPGPSFQCAHLLTRGRSALVHHHLASPFFPTERLGPSYHYRSTGRLCLILGPSLCFCAHALVNRVTSYPPPGSNIRFGHQSARPSQSQPCDDPGPVQSPTSMLAWPYFWLHSPAKPRSSSLPQHRHRPTFPSEKSGHEHPAIGTMKPCASKPSPPSHHHSSSSNRFCCVHSSKHHPHRSSRPPAVGRFATRP